MCHWIVWMSCPPCQYKPPLLSSHYCLVIQAVHVCDGCKATRAFLFLYVSGLSLSAASELCNDWSRVCVCVCLGAVLFCLGGFSVCTLHGGSRLLLHYQLFRKPAVIFSFFLPVSHAKGYSIVTGVTCTCNFCCFYMLY